MREICRRIALSFAVVAALNGAVIMVLVTTDVLLRAFGHRGVLGVDGLVELLLVGMIFLGMAYTERNGQHVSFSLISDRLPPRAAFGAQTFGLVVAIAFLVWVGWLSTQGALTSYRSGEFRFGTLGLPLWPGRTVVALGIWALVMEMVVSLLDCFRSARDGRAVGVWVDRG